MRPDAQGVDGGARRVEQQDGDVERAGGYLAGEDMETTIIVELMIRRSGRSRIPRKLTPTRGIGPNRGGLSDHVFSTAPSRVNNVTRRPY